MQVFRELEDVPVQLGPTVVSVGNFDGVHVAHQAVVRHMVARAHAIGGKAVVVTFEPHPLRILRPDVAPRLLTPLGAKLQLLEQTGVDAVLVLPFSRDLSLMSAHDFARQVLVDALHAREVHEGYNFHFGHKAQGNVETLSAFGREMGFDVHTYSELMLRGHHVSSSEIRALVAAGRVDAGAPLLGRPFSILSNPGRGRGYGTRYTVPTVNLARYDELVPANGVYITWVRINGECFDAVTNVGVRPDVRAGLVRHREPPAQLPRNRVAGTDGSRVDLPEAPARGAQVRVGGGPARADRARRAEGAEVLSDGEE